jgi:hypothetical protein
MKNEVHFNVSFIQRAPGFAHYTKLHSIVDDAVLVRSVSKVQTEGGGVLQGLSPFSSSLHRVQKEANHSKRNEKRWGTRLSD